MSAYGSVVLPMDYEVYPATDKQNPSSNSPNADSGRSPGVEIQTPAARRFVSLILVFMAGAVIGLSFVLKPDPSGYGTHCQLFLAPCMFHLLTGLPCPFCGMTTGFAHTARGEIGAAFHSHVLAPVAFFGAWLVGLHALYGLITGGRPLPRFVFSNRFWMFLLCIIVAGWAANILLAVL